MTSRNGRVRASCGIEAFEVTLVARLPHRRGRSSSRSAKKRVEADEMGAASPVATLTTLVEHG